MNSRKIVIPALGTVILTAAMAFAAPVFTAFFQATGQTTSYQADKNDGIDGPVDVPDDGALRRGKRLRYKVRGDGTIKDQDTGLIWEMKCLNCGGLHDVDNTYPWSGDGSTDTIWDWLDDVNAENRIGYAGHKDWRIPNVRELESIVDYGVSLPAIDPIFGPTTSADLYWSSTTFAFNPSFAWAVAFDSGAVGVGGKGGSLAPLRFVRAVRGGPK